MDRIDAAETYFTTVKMAEEPYYEVLEAAGLSKPFEPYVLEGIKDAFEQESQVMVDTYSHWGESFIDLLAYRGVVNGALASDGYTYFYPEDFMTRAEFCKMLFNAVKGQDRTNGKSKPQMFRDVKAESWFSEYVAWASENGIVTGNGKGKFYPDDTITREDMAVMLQRAMEAYVKGVEEQKKSKEFKDRNEISGYALEAVDTLKAGGIITGQPNGNFEPRWSVTKAEGGAAIVRLMRILPS